QPALAGGIADTASGCQAGHPGRRDETGGYGKTEGMRGMVHIAPDAARSDTNRTGSRIYADTLHRRQLDNKAALACAETAAIVATATNRGQDVVRTSVIHGGDHVRHIDTAHDERRAFVDHSVVNHAGGLVGLIAGLDDGAANAGTQLFDLNR